jgi:hypothetical protein
VRTEQSRGIALSVAREDLFLPPVNLPSLKVPFRSGSVRHHLVPFHPTRQRRVRLRSLQLTCISASKRSSSRKRDVA